MPCSTYMQCHPPTLHPYDTVEQAYLRLKALGLESLPVVDMDGVYLGQFSTQALLKLLLPVAVTMDRGLRNLAFAGKAPTILQSRYHDLKHHPIADYIITQPVAHPDTPAIEAALLLYDNDYCCLAIVDERGRLVGMLSAWQLIELARQGNRDA